MEGEGDALLCQQALLLLFLASPFTTNGDFPRVGTAASEEPAPNTVSRRRMSLPGHYSSTEPSSPVSGLAAKLAH